MKALFNAVANAVAKFFKHFPELLTIPLALLVWVVSIPVLRLIDPTSGVFDAGVFQIILFGIIAFFVFAAVAWLTMGLLFSTIRKYLKTQYKADFNTLTPWQKIRLSYSIFFLLFAVLAYLANILQ